MRLSILHSVVLGLAGLRAADASVCKPRSLSFGLSTIASTTLIALETTSSGFASESSVPSSTIVSASTEVTTGVDTTTTDATTTKADTTTIEPTSITIVSASTEVTSTSEFAVATQTTASAVATASSGTTSITDTTTAPTSIHTTTTTDAVTTTTAELPVITDFQIRGARAPVEGESIYSNRVKGNYLLFSGGYPGYTPATFSVEAISGRLLIDNSLAVCAFFQPDQDIATLSLCSDPLESQAVPISCTPPAKDGDVLSCSVPAQTCVETQISFFESSITCTPTGEVLTDTSTDFNYSINKNIPVMGQIANGVNFVVHAV